MKKLKPLYIIGAGGFGRETSWLVERINRKCAEWDFKGFLDENESLHGARLGEYTILGGFEYLEKLQADVWAVMAVGSARAREKGIARLETFDHIHFATLIDPGAELSDSVSLGEGTILCAGTIATVNVKTGKHNIINLNCTLGHDAVLEDYVTLYPGVSVSGAVKIGRVSEIGTGAQIIQGIHIGSGTLVGAGAVVIRHMEDDVTAVGNPAHVIKRHVIQNQFGGVLRRM